MNIGSGLELTIKILAKKIQKLTNFKEKVEFNTSMKNGTPRKLLNISNTKKFLKSKYSASNFDESLRIVYHDFLKRYG